MACMTGLIVKDEDGRIEGDKPDEPDGEYRIFKKNTA